MIKTLDSKAEVEKLLDKLDGTGSDAEWSAVYRLREILDGELPAYLYNRYRAHRSWRTRSSYVYHAVRYARESKHAIELGKVAIADKSKVVRYRACMLLAYSLKKDLIPFLKEAEGVADQKTREDIRATIDAIENQNHHFFVDRDHSGQMTLNIR